MASKLFAKFIVDEVGQKQRWCSRVSLIPSSLHFLNMSLVLMPILLVCDANRFVCYSRPIAELQSFRDRVKKKRLCFHSLPLHMIFAAVELKIERSIRFQQLIIGNSLPIPPYTQQHLVFCQFNL